METRFITSFLVMQVQEFSLLNVCEGICAFVVVAV